MFLNNNGLISPNQFGFMDDCSTTDAMHRLMTQVVNHLNNNQKCLSVFLDLAKAFDTVPHDRPIEVLENYGIRGVANKLLDSYLSDRYQMVKISNVVSDRQKIRIGVYAVDTAIVFASDSWEGVKTKTIRHQ